jgi:hypothetical protein
MEHETDLFRELEFARAECSRLRQENERLKQQLLSKENEHAIIHSAQELSKNGTPNRDKFEPLENRPVSAKEPAVTNASEPSAKVAFFRTLLRGRDDVYAVRWVGRNGKSGYSPAAPRERFVSSRLITKIASAFR